MDLLKKCAKEFQRLIPCQYHITIGRKGKMLAFTLSFEEADFLLQNDFDGVPVYLFLSCRSGEKTQVCRTFFPKTLKDYAQGQPRYTLLKKEKYNHITGKTIIQYDKLTPRN